MNWKYVSENPLGQFDADGRRFTLHPGYERLRLFAVLMSDNSFQLSVGYIDSEGSLCYHDSGDTVGWEWDSVFAYVDIMDLPCHLHNAEASGRRDKAAFAEPDGCREGS